MNTGVTAWAGQVHDGLVDLGPAAGLAPNSARRVDHGEATYALYRLDDDGDGGAEAPLGFALSDGLCTHGQGPPR